MYHYPTYIYSDIESYSKYEFTCDVKIKIAVVKFFLKTAIFIFTSHAALSKTNLHILEGIVTTMSVIKLKVQTRTILDLRV